ncbi:MAG TPA: Rieske 2Fe-2S domain-containing protein, partial [Dehalococcoidia bacterium]|nr:Rieske 2Fe-2S domain-containing protein [Dehalococcoidia bacterium]
MLSAEDNYLLTNTDPGSPMGELFRRFWLPVALASDLLGPDCVPVKLKVLNEDLITFRDTKGRPGLVDAYCPHRGAPMFFARNEESGLRCVYHGWKFDVGGACVDLPNTPEGHTYRRKVRIKAYPCVEAGDLIWAYMGPRHKQPPVPRFEWLDLQSTHRYVAKFRLECNYLQAMEGDYDPSHAAFLHMTTLEKRYSEEMDVGELNVNTVAGGASFINPETWGTLEDNEAGVLCTSASRRPDGSYYAGAGPLWLMPVFCAGAVANTGLHTLNIRIPIDNTSLMFFRLRWSREPLSARDLHEYRAGAYYYPAMIAGTDTPRENLSNDYQVDRLAQKTYSFSGIKSFPAQDAAVVENQTGPIADRRREHLVASDAHIIHIRRRLLRTVKA